ncbi:MAG: hypothetical protein J3Q66DRAFT_434603 [Benniella sp.]|nr:MAG: hypothetical protein J3Q66DRAFT_434603 [Benniella sp.]
MHALLLLLSKPRRRSSDSREPSPEPTETLPERQQPLMFVIAIQPRGPCLHSQLARSCVIANTLKDDDKGNKSSLLSPSLFTVSICSSGDLISGSSDISGSGGARTGPYLEAIRQSQEELKAQHETKQQELKQELQSQWLIVARLRDQFQEQRREYESGTLALREQLQEQQQGFERQMAEMKEKLTAALAARSG